MELDGLHFFFIIVLNTMTKKTTEGDSKTMIKGSIDFILK